MWFYNFFISRRLFLSRSKYKPTPLQAMAAMLIFAGFSVLGGRYHFFFPFTHEPSRFDFDVYAFVGLGLGLLTAMAFAASAAGISERMAWGKKLGQASMIGFCVLFFISVFVLSFPDRGLNNGPGPWFTRLLFQAFLGLMSWRMIQDLETLPGKKNS